MTDLDQTKTEEVQPEPAAKSMSLQAQMIFNTGVALAMTLRDQVQNGVIGGGNE